MRGIRLLPAVLLVCLAVAATAAELHRLTIHADGAEHVFRVALATSDAERAKGLMFRHSLGADEGMLFDFGGERRVSMWMRNTYIPLDMAFAGEDGVIHRIAARTEPFSEDIINGGAPTRYVLEVNGGTMARLGIEPGDRMIVPGR